MIKALLIFLCLISYSNAEIFGKDVQVEGIWRIDAAKQDVNIEIAGMVGTKMALNFNNNKVYKVNYKTLKPDSLPIDDRYSWEITKDGILHIAFNNENKNGVSNYIFNNHFNNYLKIFENISSNCYHVILQNRNGEKVHQWGAIMCKVNNH